MWSFSLHLDQWRLRLTFLFLRLSSHGHFVSLSDGNVWAIYFRRLEKEIGQNTAEYRQQLIRQTEMVGFSKTLTDLRSLVNTLPENIIVCQVRGKTLCTVFSLIRAPGVLARSHLIFLGESCSSELSKCGYFGHL